MGRYLGSARNGVWGTSSDLELGREDAAQRGPGIHTTPSFSERATARLK